MKCKQNINNKEINKKKKKQKQQCNKTEPELKPNSDVYINTFLLVF